MNNYKQIRAIKRYALAYHLELETAAMDLLSVGGMGMRIE